MHIANTEQSWVRRFTASSPEPMSPGDEAPAGTPGTAPNVCRKCGGTGTVEGRPCPECEGTGQVNTGVGGA